MNKNYLWIVFLLLSFSAFAQRNKADKLYNQMEYSAAIPYYNKAATKTVEPELLIRLADCYFKVNDMAMAEYWYRNALKMGPFKFASDYLQYGKTLKSNERYDDAKEIFNSYLNLKPDDAVGKMLLHSCDIVKNWPKDTLGYQIEKVTSLNSEASDFCPVFYKDGIVFTSSRRTNFLDQSLSGWTGKAYQDIFYAEISRENSKFHESKPFSDVINSPSHDGPACFSDDNRTIYFTRVSEEFEKDVKVDKQMISRLKIYISEYDNGKWSNPTPFLYNSDAYSVGHPSISKDGKRLFFVSDMPGGVGGTDIYFCELQDGTWAKPQNAGSGINTAGDEKFPYMHSDGTLYFSSDGRTGFGGLDIFSTEEKNGSFTQATNLKYPINSSMDDFGMILAENSKTGYFSSNRKGGFGEDDIYFIWKKEKPDSLLLSKILQSIEDSSDEVSNGIENSEVKKIEEINSTQKDSIIPAIVAPSIQKDSSLNFSFKSTTYVPEEKKEKEEKPLTVIPEVKKTDPLIEKEKILPSVPEKNLEKFYSVQIGRYNVIMHKDSFPEIHGVEMTQEGNFYIYHIGKFSNYQEAKSLCMQLKDHLVPDAFVTAYINGNKVSLSEMSEKTQKTNIIEKPKTIVETPKKPIEKVIEKPLEKTIVKPTEPVVEKIPAMTSTPECYLTIQLGSFSKEKDKSLFKNIPGLMMVSINNLFIYSIGKYKDYSEAAKASGKIKEQGFPDAFISARIDRQSVKIEDFVNAYTSGKCVCNPKP